MHWRRSSSISSRLPAVVDRDAARKDDVFLFEETGSNVAGTITATRGDTDAAFKNAPYVRREHFKVQRHGAVPMEPRGLVADWDAAKQRVTVSGVCKVPFNNRRALAQMMKLPETSVRMLEYDVGGGFGARGEFYPEDFLIPFAARVVGRPVKWIEDRRENLMSLSHARDAACDLEIACSRDGTILALRGHAFTDLGAYVRTNGATASRNISQIMSGPYRIPHVRMDVTMVVTNKTPSGTYRGPGRFESDFCRERLFDMVAADLGIDRVEFRRRNLIAEADMPYALAKVQVLDIVSECDSGDYQMTLDRCLAEFNWAERSKLQGKLIDGRYHGIAIGCYLEGGGTGPRENARLVIEADGKISVFVGSSSVGQGVETVFSQIAADALELPMERINNVFHGSTDYVTEGFGSFSSRSIVMGGNAIVDAANRLRALIREAAAQRLGCAANEIAFDNETVVGPNRAALDLKEFAGLCRRRHARQQQADLFLWRACRLCGGRSEDRPGRIDRLCRRRRRRPHRQSADLARPMRRRRRAGPGRRVARALHLRRERPIPHRLVRRLPDADRERFPEHPRGGARAKAVAAESDGHQGCRRGRHHSGRRRRRQCRRRGAGLAGRAAARIAADAAAGVAVDTGRIRVAQSRPQIGHPCSAVSGSVS